MKKPNPPKTTGKFPLVPEIYRQAADFKDKFELWQDKCRLAEAKLAKLKEYVEKKLEDHNDWRDKNRYDLYADILALITGDEPRYFK